MIRAGDRIFVDTGAWVAVVVAADTHHDAAAASWRELLARGAKPCTSVPVVIETLTFLQRKAGLDLALRFRSALAATPRLELFDCTAADLSSAWTWFERRDLHKLSLVDATSFTLMKKHKLRRAFSFDVHFVTAGFGVV